jgi:hypothetical protein
LKPEEAWTRFYTDVPSIVHKIHTRLTTLVQRLISPQHAPKQGMLLHSAQVNLRQYIHRDYNDSVCMLRRVKTKQGPEFYTDAERSTQSFNYSSRPARLASCGIIVALEDNTRFVCWPGSHHGLTRTEGQSCPSLGGVYDSEVVCPTVSKGDVIIFMDTLAHAGAPYTRPNTRMHFYCDNVVEE